MTRSFVLVSLVFLVVSMSCGMHAVEAFFVCSNGPLACRFPRYRSIRTSSPQNSASNSSKCLRMFGNLFGGSDNKSADGELASFTNLAKTKEDVDIAYDSITTYLEDWAKLFEGDGGKQRGLTTPVTVSSFVPPAISDDNDEAAEDRATVESSGVKLIFKPPKDNYYSKSEEQEKEKGQQEKKEEVSPGGVQVIAQKASNGNELRVVARRCDIEEGKTIIKEMSEQTIIDDLGKAIKIWKEERK